MFSVPILTNCSIRRPIIKIRLITRAANLIIKRHEILKLIGRVIGGRVIGYKHG